MKYAVVPGLIGLLALAGCNASGKVQPKAGEWEWVNTGEITQVTGVPDSIGQQMMAQKPPVSPPERSCITPTDAQKDITDLNGLKSDACSFTNVKSEGGKFSGHAKCGGTAGPMITGEGELSGTIQPEAIELNIDMAVTVPMPVATDPKGATMHVKMLRKGKYVGECPAKKS